MKAALEAARDGGGTREAELAEDVVPARPKVLWLRFSCTNFAGRTGRISTSTTKHDS